MTISDEKIKVLEEIGLIAMDLDRTLLSSSGLTEYSKDCLEEAIRKGFQVVAATGRPFSALPEHLHLPQSAVHPTPLRSRK
jgi:hydroxymethylpyrimidine pyrophosphatase-like HAD family hydrolase